MLMRAACSAAATADEDELHAPLRCVLLLLLLLEGSTTGQPKTWIGHSQQQQANGIACCVATYK
jgi:hypothetical protein